MRRFLPLKIKRLIRGFIRLLMEKTIINWRLGRGVVSRVDVTIFGANNPSDISDHLNFLAFVLAVKKPRVVVELGTRGGESTRVLENYCGSNQFLGRSVDLSPAPDWLNKKIFWKHFVFDDCQMAREIRSTNKWPDGLPFEPIDFLFIDTSHEYVHTKSELEEFFPLVATGGLVAFHDTNLTNHPSRRLDGSLGYGWDNQRGVVRAIEEYLEIEIDEKSFIYRELSKEANCLIHFPWNNGLTIVQKR